jgi:hypothetical protein
MEEHTIQYYKTCKSFPGNKYFCCHYYYQLLSFLLETEGLNFLIDIPRDPSDFSVFY